MRRWMAAPLLVAAAAALCPNTQPRALAQNNNPVEETFLTADGVQLNGLFTKSTTNPGTDPVVILLYPPGKGNTMAGPGDWKGLAKRLSEKGYNVFQFDWRGHGKSTDIKDTMKFWQNPFTAPWNSAKYITGAPVPGKKVKNDIFFKDLKPQFAVGYLPVYTLDLAAARYHLDGKNDTGDLNTSSVYLIGAGDAATIGMAWITAEWNRPASAPTPNQLGANPRYEFIPQPLNGGIPTEAGADISGAVWLTGTHPATTVRQDVIQNWVAKDAPKLRDNNPMLFLYGAGDGKGKAEALFFFNQVLVANPPKTSPLQKLDQTFMKDVPGTNLTGAALLGNDKMLGTESTIEKFLDAIQKNRAKIVRKNRGFANPYFLDLRAFGFMP